MGRFPLSKLLAQASCPGELLAKFGVCRSKIPANTKFRLFSCPLSIENFWAGRDGGTNHS